MAQLLLALVFVASLALIPLGLPGLWIMIGAAFAFNALAAPAHIGTVTLVAAVVLGIIAEVLEFTIAGRYTKKFGGSRRAGWGAIAGGFIGAFLGVPIPIVGSVIGGFVGAFAGAFVAEWTRRDAAGSPTRVATGAVLGRAAGAAIKTAFGLAIAAWLMVAALN